MTFQKQLEARSKKGGKGISKIMGLKKTKTEPAGAGVKKTRKPHKWKSGTVALREIKKQQRSTKNLISRSPYVRLMREQMSKVKENSFALRAERLTSGAIEAAMEATQAYLVEMFEKAMEATIHANRTTLFEKDMIFATKNSDSLSLGDYAVGK